MDGNMDPPDFGGRAAAVSPASLHQWDVDGLVHPYTNAVSHQEHGSLIMTKGSGVTVTDTNGRDYIDAMAGLWCAALGFSEPRLAEVARQQMQQLSFYHLFSQKAHEPAIRLAERLRAMAPMDTARVFFCNSGSEANDTAVKIVRYVNNARGRPEKKKIIARLKGYHGVTMMAASLSGLPALHQDFDLPLPGVTHVTCPDPYHEQRDGETDAEFVTRLAADLEATIQAEGPETVAAFIAEPIMGAGGVILPPPGYFPAIQEILRRHDVLMIADEVICGFGRTGRLWGSESLNIHPDIVTCAKALTAGTIPLSAVLVSEELYADLRDQSGKNGTFGHGYTYSGHPVAAAVALETLDIYAERDIVGAVGKTGPIMQNALGRFADHPLVGHVRGMGLIGALELVADKTEKRPFAPVGAVGAKLVSYAQDEGVILRNLGDSIAFSPPLIITPSELEQVFDRVSRAFDRLMTDPIVGRSR